MTIIYSCQPQRTQMPNPTCPKCELPYSTHNPPKRLVNCNHTICLQCLHTQILCPVDHKRIQRRKYTIEGFQNDMEVLAAMAAGGEDIDQDCEESEDQNMDRSLKETSVNVEITVLNKPNCSPSLKKDQLTFSSCLLHLKPSELLCLQDKCLICSNCGLFGEHKGHSLLPYDQFVLSFGSLAEQCLQIRQQLQQRRNKVNKKAISARIEAEINMKGERQRQKIDSFINSILEEVNIFKQNLLQSLEEALKQKRTSLLSRPSASFLSQKTASFLSQAGKVTQGLQDIFIGRDIQQYVQYVDQRTKKSQLVKEGIDLVQHIDQEYRKDVEKVVQEMKGVGYCFRKIRRDLFQGFAQKETRKHSSHGSPKTERDKIDDILLIQNGQPQNTFNIHHNSLSPIVPVDSFEYNLEEHHLIEPPLSHTLQPSTIVLPKHTDRAIVLPKHTDMRTSLPYNRHPAKQQKDPLEVQSRSLVNSIEKSICGSNLTEKDLLRTLNNQKLLNKRRKKLQLPDKYAKIYEDLQKDHLDVLDLGGAFLGDTTISRIVQLVPTRTRLRSVKLMNNKLTDQTFGFIIEQCRNVGTVNLSYNLLTDKALDFIQLNCQKLGYLQNIALSHNKIVLRNVKERVERLKRQGIKVSL